MIKANTITAGQFFFPNKPGDKSTQRRQPDTVLDGMSGRRLRIVSAKAKGIEGVEKQGESHSRTSLWRRDDLCGFRVVFMI